MHTCLQPRFFLTKTLCQPLNISVSHNLNFLHMIAVISDSHIPDRANSIPEVFQVKMKDADMVVHCGDFESEKVYRRLSENHDLIGCKGKL
jgi:Predicted phosphoesterase